MAKTLYATTTRWHTCWIYYKTSIPLIWCNILNYTLYFISFENLLYQLIALYQIKLNQVIILFLITVIVYPNTLFRIISIPSKFCYFRPPDHVISMEHLALNFRCQCTQQKLQSICNPNNPVVILGFATLTPGRLSR